MMIRECLTSDRLRFAAQWLTALIPFALIFGPAASEILILSILVLVLLDSFLRRDWKWLQSKWLIILSILWAFLIIRGAFALDTAGALKIALPWIHYPLFAAALAGSVLTDNKAQRRLLISLTIMAVFIAADTLVQYFLGYDVFGRVSAYGARLTGPLDRPRVGILLAWIAFPVLLDISSQTPSFKDFDKAFLPLFLRKSLTAVAVVLGTLLAIYLSGERMALLLCLSGIGVAFFASRQSRWAIAASLSIGLIVIMTLNTSHPELKSRQIEKSSSEIASYWESAYGQTVLSSFAIWKANPLIGIGVHNFRAVCSDPSYGPTTPEALHLRCPMHPHQLYMEWLAESGLVGLSLFLCAIGAWIAQCYGARRKIIEDPVLTGLFITALIRLWPLSATPSQFVPWSAVPFWLMIGFLLARIKTERKN